MSGVTTREISPADAGMRLDRWFKSEFPGLSFGQLSKLLRTGQIRVNGKRAKGSTRLGVGDQVRIPPLHITEQTTSQKPPRPLKKEDYWTILYLIIAMRISN